MDARTFDKSKLTGRHVTEGQSRAPHGAASCNMALMRQAQSTKKGVDEAGGTPREFYADQVSAAARKGAVTHAGGEVEVVCYADI
jgi:hypothetical protein